MGSWHLQQWQLPIVKTPKESFQALFMMMIACLHEPALGLLEESMGPYNEVDCGLRALKIE